MATTYRRLVAAQTCRRALTSIMIDVYQRESTLDRHSAHRAML
jgi:hypothetical protein